MHCFSRSPFTWRMFTRHLFHAPAPPQHMQPNVWARVLLSPSNPGLQDPEIAMIEGCDDVCSYRMFGTSKHTDSYMRNNNLHGRLRIAKFAILVAARW